MSQTIFFDYVPTHSKGCDSPVYLNTLQGRFTSKNVRLLRLMYRRFYLIYHLLCLECFYQILFCLACMLLVKTITVRRKQYVCQYYRLVSSIFLRRSSMNLELIE